jgi:hypothetical protein
MANGQVVLVTTEGLSGGSPMRADAVNLDGMNEQMLWTYRPSALHLRCAPEPDNSHFSHSTSILAIKSKSDLNPKDFSVIVVSYVLND